MNKSFVPTNRIPSAWASVEASGGVKRKSKPRWELSQRLPADVVASIALESRARAARGLPV
jgi:hypothetical protein